MDVEGRMLEEMGEELVLVELNASMGVVEASMVEGVEASMVEANLTLANLTFANCGLDLTNDSIKVVKVSDRNSMQNMLSPHFCLSKYFWHKILSF